MDVVQLGPENNPKFSYTHEPNPSTDSTALRPAQCHADDSWSTVGTQVLVTSESIVEQESVSWSPSRDIDRIASMKIFTSVMLHAWRQRRADVRRLQQVVERLQRKSMHSKNELHVSNTLMRVEQKRCKELQLELKKSTLSINEVRSSCERLSTSVRSLKADKDQLEKELNFSRQEQLELERKVGKCKDDLLSALMEQRNLQLRLSEEQSNVQQLAREKELLSINMRSMETEFGRREESYIQELEQKNEALHNMRMTIENLERRLRDRQIKRYELKHYLKNMERRELDDFQTDLETELPPNMTAITRLPSSSVKRSTLALIAEDYGIGQLWSTVHYYTSSAALLLWFVILPKQSLRNGCMPIKKRIASLK
ncbi:227 kDa spindle- and centromere-associated protein isoform X1 [Drosophila virilis]|uniref:Uncharacterized protein n=1 Tax=Drosophila virilis TaxID=7244 RepID=B4MDE1_DROVI|nr:protein FAM184A isoform X1 [Drosophila virilis]EDW71202.2 uncharacterized protein Dvir_GJ16191 [Drosophila virilis]